MRHDGSCALKDVKVRSLDFSITLRDTWLTRLPQNSQFFTGSFYLTRAVRVNSADFGVANKILNFLLGVRSTSRFDRTKVLDPRI